MQSYYSMLSNRQQLGESFPPNYRPTFRSSAIFPVLDNEHCHSRILFMGYWLLKRNIREIGMLITLRSESGTILDRSYLCIDSPKAYNIEVGEILRRIENKATAFTGSLELEIFSTVDLVYPYPAFVVNYYDEHFSTAVHSVGRIYNDVEDMTGNEEYVVREAGFDIYATPEQHPFVSFTNGPWANETFSFDYEVVNHANQKLSGSFSPGPLSAFQTSLINFSAYIPELVNFLDGKKGTINIGHNLKGLFPRFVVGNIDQKSQSMSITHSYYDSSPFTDAKSYWNRLDDRFIDSSIAIPLYITEGYYTELAIYPIFSASDFNISLSFFDAQGILTGKVENAATITGNKQEYQTIDFGNVIAANGIDASSAASVRIECIWNDKQKIPTRVKFGMNVGHKDALPCNICFAPQLGNPNILHKKSTFKWSPLLNNGVSEIVLTNSSSLINYDRPAIIEAKVYREKDDSFLERTIEIPAFGVHTINTEKDAELNQFLEGGTGWLTAFSENPNIYGWYFDFNESGSVAADHIF